MKKTRSHCMCHSIACLVLFSTSLSRADQIYFRTGRSLEGIIQSENDKEVVISLGAGSMSIPRSKILRIERTADHQNRALQKEWRSRHFLHPQYVPKGMESLARSARELQNQRRQAIASQRTLATIKREIKAKDIEIDNANRQHLEVSRQLSKLRPQQSVEQYNQLVARNNLAASRINVLRHERAELTGKQADAAQPTGSYTSALASLAESIEAKKRSLGQGASTEEVGFLHRIDALANGWRGDFRDVKAHTTRRGKHTLVQARINNRRVGTFLVDTGASTLTLTHRFAQAVGIDPGNLPQHSVSLADGQTVSAGVIRLDSLQLGDSKLEDVQAVVMPQSPGEDLDGLLGMNVLQNFHLIMDPARGTLQLQQFRPRE